MIPGGGETMRYDYGKGKVTAYYASNHEPEIRGVDTLPKELKEDILGCKSKSAKYLAQRFIDIICGKMGIKSVKVKVHDKPRPQSEDKDGNSCQLYGQYVFDGADSPIKLEIWNRTAVKKDRIPNGSFLDTLKHEFIHHYDVCMLQFETSPHTKGFFRRIKKLDELFGKGAG